MVAAQIHGKPAHDDGHGRVNAHGDEEEGSVLECVVVVHGDEDAEADDGEADGGDGEGETVLELVAEVGDDHGEGERGCPGGHRVQLRLDSRVAVRLDDAGGEKGVAVRRHNEAEVHETADEDLVIFKHVDDVPNSNRALCCGAALVLAQAVLDVGPLVFGQPFCFLWEIGDDKVEYEGDHTC